ncbi:hypothetical protein TEA_010935 [Camellia sinensis var. sinensis]|uniref:RING-type domain-containing protein n=1 Tax=Camellia sinensis var. sinensis TaxID=542762 RepID=A0A4S4DHU8_CAMSN|nr:hypothetical protein TEA_010935 [Camellia sinensis var. sinensis]
MAVSMQEPNQENQADRYPLLMEPQENNENQVHFIDIERGCDASSSGSSHNGSPCGSTLPHHEDRLSNSVRVVPITQSTSSSSNESNSRNSSVTRRGEGSGRRHWSPFNTVLWLSVELVFTVGQIIAAIIVLSVSGHENPQTPLFAWIVGYAVGCAASVPLLFWRYLNRNQGTEQGSTQLRQDSSQGNSTSEPNSYITISLTRASEEEDGQNTSSGTRTGQIMGAPNARLNALMDHLKMALDCFFAVWFVVGNVWIFGGNSSFSDAPNLYRLCIVFLTFSCIGYAMPFILCSVICCCLPCVISFLGVRDDMNRMRGASEETINALPTHKFKLKDKGSRSNCDSNPGVDEGGFVAAGTERERVISGEDAGVVRFLVYFKTGPIPSVNTPTMHKFTLFKKIAHVHGLHQFTILREEKSYNAAVVCCICLARYADNDELRELPCSHFFHTECVDKWLKINASCPLCKFEIGDSNGNSSSTGEPSQQV